MEQLLFLNRELFHMIEDSISLDLLARLYSTQLTTNGEKHLLDHNRDLLQAAAKDHRQGSV